MKIIQSIADAWTLLKEGKIIAYPTEAVYGLGCDPFNERAVETLTALKQRQVEKGLIVLIANWQQLDLLALPLPESCLQPVRNSWPGPVTWIFPKSEHVPLITSGHHETIAVRMSAHPIARELCAHQPVVSTSANLSGKDPACTIEELMQQFPQGIDGVLSGELGGAASPSKIYDVRTGKRLR
jgi:L-threonylcarbamoyladenylate synthase